MKKYIVFSVVFLVAGFAYLVGGLAQATISPLNTTSPTPIPTPAQPSPLGCYDFNQNLRVGMKSAEVRFLQSFLLKEGFGIPVSSYGMYDAATRDAVKGFQEKYFSDILSPAKLNTGSGYFGKLTQAKLNALYGCGAQVAMMQSQSSPTPLPVPMNVKLAVTSLSMDPSGITVSACNQGVSNVPTFPVRIRLNGINRDFDITGALAAGACDTNTISYDTWGISFDSGSTIGSVILMDPNGVYKSGKLSYPVNGDSKGVSIPAVAGLHLAVRSLSVKSTGIQGTFCNLGTMALQNFPVRITVNGTAKDLDVPGAYAPGKCQTTAWPYETWGSSYVAGTTYSATAITDPNNIYREITELDNIASVIGIP